MLRGQSDSRGISIVKCGFYIVAGQPQIIDVELAARESLSRATDAEVIAFSLKQHSQRIKAAREKISSHTESPPKPSAGKKLESFTTAHALLLIEGRVIRKVAEYRHTSCSGLSDGVRVSEPCPRYNAADDYCKACGCPEWRIAKMIRKVWYPADICPLKRFSRVAGRRAGRRS